jgi:hypothetical protein
MGGDAGTESDLKLGAADDIRATALGSEGTDDGSSGVGLDGISDEVWSVVERGPKVAGFGGDAVEVVGVGGGAVVGKEVDEADPTEGKEAVFIAERRHGLALYRL